MISKIKKELERHSDTLSKEMTSVKDAQIDLSHEIAGIKTDLLAIMDTKHKQILEAIKVSAQQK